MLITYFKDSRTLARYRSGLANLYLENFIVWLESQGYRRFTIRRHYGAAALTRNELALNHFLGFRRARRQIDRSDVFTSSAHNRLFWEIEKLVQ
jgi:hypothetical protein